MLRIQAYYVVLATMFHYAYLYPFHPFQTKNEKIVKKKKHLVFSLALQIEILEHLYVKIKTGNGSEKEYKLMCILT